MKSDQYHLCKIAEEGCEIAQRAIKAQQFGLDETQDGQQFNNLERLVGEVHDLIVTFENFLELINREDLSRPDDRIRRARLAKMEAFLELSKSLNQVDETAVI